MPPGSITARYLRELDHPILPLPESRSAKIRYAGRYLSRPVFLEAQERRELERVLPLLWSALSTLPQRRYDGDLKAFARAVGMTELQAEYVVPGSGPATRTLTRMARADLYKDANGFRLLEWNLGSTIGGVECVDMCRALLAAPELAAFVAKEGLEFADTYDAMLATLRFETGYPVGTDPVVALVETPGSFSDAETRMRDRADRWVSYGFRTVVGHLGELTRSGGRLRLRGEPIDVVYRMFTFEDVLGHFSDGLLEPLRSATERGEVAVFTSLEAELYGSKGALALLSDPAGQVGLTPQQREACARLLPWTRQVQAGEVVVEDGSSVDLLAYVREHQQDLVLKPSLSYGGSGVVVGADPDITPATWRRRLAEAVNGSYVVQRLVRPVPELFPSADQGRLLPWTVVWGVFTMWQGFAGVAVRAVPVDTPESIVNLQNRAALVGCGFHARA